MGQIGPAEIFQVKGSQLPPQPLLAGQPCPFLVQLPEASALPRFVPAPQDILFKKLLLVRFVGSGFPVFICFQVLNKRI